MSGIKLSGYIRGDADRSVTLRSRSEAQIFQGGVTWTLSVCSGMCSSDYKSFVQGFLNIRDPVVLRKVEQEVSNGLMWPEPWLALNPAFRAAARSATSLTGGCCTRGASTSSVHGRRRIRWAVRSRFHRHQRDAIEIAARGESYVLTTGTGSGKSLAYIVPIVDRVLRDGCGQGVRAIVVYPMNALANSQTGELEKFLGHRRAQGHVRPVHRAGEPRRDGTPSWPTRRTSC